MVECGICFKTMRSDNLVRHMKKHGEKMKMEYKKLIGVGYMRFGENTKRLNVKFV